MGANIDNLVEELRGPCRDLIAACFAAGLQPRLTSTLRSYAEQKRLYRRFLAGQAGFPVVPPGFSAHEYGEAFDLVVTPMDALADVGYTWQSWGGAWSERDAVHFELPGASGRAAAEGKKSSNVVAEVAQTFSDLPWWATLPLPAATMTTESHEKQILDKLCKSFGLFCGS
jgi:D-alanyl-D-alanine carboxypeptidase